jgi:hypothetical protein
VGASLIGAGLHSKRARHFSQASPKEKGHSNGGGYRELKGPGGTYRGRAQVLRPGIKVGETDRWGENGCQGGCREGKGVVGRALPGGRLAGGGEDRGGGTPKGGGRTGGGGVATCGGGDASAQAHDTRRLKASNTAQI